MYDFERKRWTILKEMNHSHQSGGICEWKDRGNKIIVAAGYDTNKVVEEYDLQKNVWIDLPELNNKHPTYPALMTSDNILFCIGGGSYFVDDLGCIELYDARDSANKWHYVDTVSKYFDLANCGCAGFNSFLPC